MCGRITLTVEPGELARAFGIDQVPEWLHGLVPRYNIAPSLPLVAVRQDPEGGEPSFAALRWGLVPFWAKDPGIGMKMINARSETVAEKPAFKQAFARRRCLVAVDGFYEWQRTGKSRQPYWFHAPDRGPFALAGLWESWRDGSSGEVLETCSVLTTDANALMEPIHNRMPVILAAEQYDIWLATPPEQAADLLPMLGPCPADRLAAHPVTRRVNRPVFDEPACLEPVDLALEAGDARPARKKAPAREPAAGDAEKPRQRDLFEDGS
jgi:putative SOS response-associated peptidase YedK